MKWPFPVARLLTLVLIDQLIKYLALSSEAVPGRVHINRFASFTTFTFSTTNMLLLLGGSLLVTLLIAQGVSNPRSRQSVKLILAGGISNLIDRIRIGGVIDILHVGRLSFNIADIFIFLGVTLLLVQMVNREEAEKARYPQDS